MTDYKRVPCEPSEEMIARGRHWIERCACGIDPVEGIAERVWDEMLAVAPAPSGEAIHYPDCWDTAAYPTLESALSEVYACFRCAECHPPATDGREALTDDCKQCDELRAQIEAAKERERISAEQISYYSDALAQADRTIGDLRAKFAAQPAQDAEDAARLALLLDTAKAEGHGGDFEPGHEPKDCGSPLCWAVWLLEGKVTQEQYDEWHAARSKEQDDHE